MWSGHHLVGRHSKGWGLCFGSIGGIVGVSRSALVDGGNAGDSLRHSRAGRAADSLRLCYGHCTAARAELAGNFANECQCAGTSYNVPCFLRRWHMRSQDLRMHSILRSFDTATARHDWLDTSWQKLCRCAMPISMRQHPSVPNMAAMSPKACM